MTGGVLVTGANGFVGSHLVERLVARGVRVRVLVRSTSRVDALPASAVEFAYGEMTDANSLVAAATGVHTVFHLAGVTRAPQEAAYQRINVEGTRALAAAARDAGVGRFVLVSSLAAGGPSQPGSPRSERDTDAPMDPYGRSKLAGEHALREVAGNLAWCVVRPAAVYGPRDLDFLKLAAMVRRGWRLEISGPPQRVSVIHVGDAAQGILAASERAENGGVYYLAHAETTTWPEICRVMGRHMRRGTRPLWVPRAAIGPVAGIAGFLARLAGKPSPLPRDRVAALLAPAWTCDTGRATRELGFTASVGLDEGMRETVAWYARNGYLKGVQAAA